jgi:hypothetical protein
MEFQDGDMTSLKGMVALPAERARETQMAYVDGYLLALQDVLRAIGEHRDWATSLTQNIETVSYFAGATKMHKKVRTSIEAMIVATRKKLHVLKAADIVAQDAEILMRLKETDGAD